MELNEVIAIVNKIRLGGPFEGKWFHVGEMGELLEDPVGTPEMLFVQVRYYEPDIHTGKMEEQQARVWHIPSNATESQVVQICFGAALASAEHQVREFFTYEDKRVFGPHMDIAGLAAVAR